MIRFPSMLIVLLLLSVGSFNYWVKNTFHKNDKEIKKIQNIIFNSNERIQLMNAEISYLSRPERIEYLAINVFKMRELLPIDIWNIEDISQLYFQKTINKEK